MIRGGVLKGGLQIEDDEVRKPDEYGGLDPNRKKDKFEKSLDDMLFGGMGGPPVRRPRPEVKKQQPKPVVPNTPTNPTEANTSKPAEPTSKPNVIEIKGSTTVVGINKSGQGSSQIKKQPTPEQKPAVNISNTSSQGNKKEPSIVVPSDSIKPKDPSGGTLGLISKPVINNYVTPTQPSNNNQSQTQPIQPTKNNQSTQPAQSNQYGKTNQQTQPAPQPPAPQVVPKQPQVSQPTQQPQVISIEAIHPFGNKNKFNKPGYLRKQKKVAEDFNFAEENANSHSAVDVVRPAETDRTQQKKRNDFDFHDFEFPAASSSFGITQRETASTWKRPNEIAKTVNFGKYIDPNDFQPGTLSSPHFLSALSGIAELQANTKRLIEDQKTNSNGFYLIRLFVNSVWRYIAVDHFLPFIGGENAGVLSNTEGGETDLQGSLIEKAYAKSFGGYDSFARVQPREYYLRDLTGAPVKKYAIDSFDLQNIVKKALASGQVVQAVPTDKIAALGANPNFSYSVINYSSKGSLELRNSWGTVEQRSKTSFKTEGNFELSAGVLKDNISHLLVSTINPKFFTTTVQSKHRLGFYSTYSFKVRNNTQGFLTVSQWDQRLFPTSSNYHYSPATIVLQRDVSEDHAEFVSANHSISSRNLDLEVNLTPGNYTVFVAVNWLHEDHSFNLSFYGSERVDFSRVYNEKNPNHIAQSLEALNLEHGTRKQLSKSSVQYFSYNHDSNLLLITVEAVKSGVVTLDLSRAKLENATLISGHNNQDNYSEKVAYEIEEYKHIPLNDRRWSVSLQAGHHFTWVLASKDTFDQSNPRLWGFV